MSKKFNRNFIFVSDLHLSEGYLKDENRYHPNEDFYFDDAFGRFLKHLQGRRRSVRKRDGYKIPWRLVIVGDFLENLQITTFPRVPEDNTTTNRSYAKVDSPENLPGDSTEAVDELRDFLRNVQSIIYPDPEVRPDFGGIRFSPNEKYYGLGFDGPKSVWKLARIIDGHPEFFSALAEFLAAGNELVIIKGNHDPEFTYPELRRYLVDRLTWLAPKKRGRGNIADRIFFSPWFYYEPGLFYAEHGGQYDEANRYAFFLQPTMTYEKTGVRTIRFPLFGSSFVRYFFNIIEKEVPFADNLRPQSKALFWIVTRKPGFTVLHLPDGLKCLWKFLQKKVFHGFDLLALREKYKSKGFLGFPAFAFFSVTGLFLVRPKHRKEYQADKIKNLREMNRLENTDGISWRDGKRAGRSLPLRDLLRIYYGSFGERSAAVDDAGLDDVQRAFAREEGEEEALDRKERKSLEKVIADTRAAKAKSLLKRIIKYSDFIAFAVLTVGAGVACFAIRLNYPQYLTAGLCAFIVVVPLILYIFHDLKRNLMAKFFDAAPERYLNKAAAGVARLLGPDRVRFVIFGHTHVAYARPIKEDPGTGNGGPKEDKAPRPSQWEINTGSWTPVFDERMMLRQNGDEFPFIQIVTEKAGAEPDFESYRWNDELGRPQRIRFVGDV